MKNAKSVFALSCFVALVATAVSAASYAPVPVQSAPHGDATYTPVSAEPMADETITVSEVLITAPRMTHKATRATKLTDCSFGFRPVTQGPVGSTVRGFCL